MTYDEALQALIESMDPATLEKCGVRFGGISGSPPVTCTRVKHGSDTKHYSHPDHVSWW
jgi:hypothetical protein